MKSSSRIFIQYVKYHYETLANKTLNKNLLCILEYNLFTSLQEIMLLWCPRCNMGGGGRGGGLSVKIRLW